MSRATMPRPGSQTTSLRRRLRIRAIPLWVAYAMASALVAVLYVGGPLNAGPVYNLLGASSAAAVAIGAAIHRPRGRIAWYLIAAGQALCVAGDVVAYNYDHLFGRELPFPSVADPIYLAMYPCIAAGLLTLVRFRHAGGDRAGMLDSLIVAIGLGTLSWVYLIAPYAHDATLTLAERLTSMAYPLMDTVLLGVGVRLLLGAARRGPSSHLLACGLVTLLVTDAVYGWLSLNGGYFPGGLLDAGWLASYVLCGTAALHPSMRAMSEPVARRGAGLTRRRLALLAATSVLAPGLQLVRAMLDQPREPLIPVAAAVLFLLVLARLTGLARFQESLVEDDMRRRFETRLAALVRNARDVVSLLGPDGRLAYLSPSASTLTGRSADELMETSLLDLVHPDDAADVLAFVKRLGPGESGSVVFRLRHANGSWRDVETLATNLIADEMVGGIVLNTRDVSERTALERRLEHQAFHDALTSLPNRNLFQDRVQHAFTRLRRHGMRFAVLFLDLDDFKTINDSLGHAAGDAVLREVAARLEGAARTTDSAARLGGDEFALLADGIRDDVEAVAVAERVMEAIARPIALDGHEFTTTPSIGIAFATHGAGAEELLRDADAAMYLAKAQGKGRYAIFQPAMHAAAMERLQLKADLQKAVRDGDISLVYQPVVDLRRREIVGVEALARWAHEERGPVSPAEFIPLAEETGLIVAMGTALLRKACRQAAMLQAACPREPALTMSVNLSARQLQSPALVGEVRDALRESGIPPSSLVLELTESAMIEDVELVTARLEELRALGVSLAIDDFGTGYSSLTYIRRFPVDVLKIDRSFIDGVGCGSEQTEALTASILQLAGVLSLKPVAEGIEDAAQLARLVELGCEVGQGYHLHRPLAGAAVEALVRAQAAAAAAV